MIEMALYCNVSVKASARVGTGVGIKLLDLDNIDGRLSLNKECEKRMKTVYRCDPFSQYFHAIHGQGEIGRAHV